MRIDGLLILDKPSGMTSLDVVREVKKRFSIKKAGHIGTLDPFATGVLPIALNEGTKLIPFLEDEPKAYEAVMKLGEERITDDATGEVVQQGEWRDLSSERVEAVSQSFLGRIRQTPPMFSAVKVNGKALYRLARKGMEIEREEREVFLYDLQIVKIDLPLVHFKVTCSKGTYIRALARDIGRKIGSRAHLTALRRTQSGPFSLAQSLSMEDLRALNGAEALFSCLIPLREVLFDLPEVIGDDHLIRKARHGREMMVKDLDLPALPAFEEGEWLRMSSPEQELVAILRSEIGWKEIEKAAPERVAFRPLRIIQPSSQG